MAGAKDYEEPLVPFLRGLRMWRRFPILPRLRSRVGEAPRGSLLDAGWDLDSATVAQLVEQGIRNAQVSSSNLLGGSK
jgi:hypothetical protein